MKHGIRYLDIRLSTRDDNSALYLPHGNDLPIIDTLFYINIYSNFDIHYFNNVTGECTKFLDEHENYCYSSERRKYFRKK